MDTPEITALFAWLREQLPQLIDCGDAWQVTLHGGPNGEVKAEVNRKQQLLSTQKERRNGHGNYTNGSVRPVR